MARRLNKVRSFALPLRALGSTNPKPVVSDSFGAKRKTPRSSYEPSDFEDIDYFDAIESDPNRSKVTWAVGGRAKIGDKTLIVGPRDMSEKVSFDRDAEQVFKAISDSVQ